MHFRKLFFGLAFAPLLAGLGCDRDQAVTGSAQSQPAPAEPSEPEATAAVAQGSPKILARGIDTAPPEPSTPSPCPDDMVLVEGDYCPQVQHTCLHFLDPPGRYENFRCAEYGEPKCLSSARESKRYCIDRDEYAQPGENLPANHKSFTHAEKTCGALGKRVCTESEWNFACEGEEMRPYPYGFKRDPSACNADRTDIVTPGGELRDLRAPADAYPRCTSPFGVRNLSGNLEEFVAMDGPGPARPAMKGAYWQPSRNFCRAKQTAHDRYYNGTETGFRCCSEPEAP